MRFSLPQQGNYSLTQLLDQLSDHIKVHNTVPSSLLRRTLDACFSSGLTLDEVETALQCEVDQLEQVSVSGAQQLIQLLQQRQL
ncbi:hypothetical protein [Motilimonas sp. KMU-193]|uniref:hypothetical protein n=1 Tax=Motilimonas sp. KMU-193 TaxID=3388668 RepID=UPI00396AEFD6